MGKEKNETLYQQNNRNQEIRISVNEESMQNSVYSDQMNQMQQEEMQRDSLQSVERNVERQMPDAEERISYRKRKKEWIKSHNRAEAVSRLYQTRKFLGDSKMMQGIKGSLEKLNEVLSGNMPKVKSVFQQESQEIYLVYEKLMEQCDEYLRERRKGCKDKGERWNLVHDIRGFIEKEMMSFHACAEAAFMEHQNSSFMPYWGETFVYMDSIQLNQIPADAVFEKTEELTEEEKTVYENRAAFSNIAKLLKVSDLVEDVQHKVLETEEGNVVGYMKPLQDQQITLKSVKDKLDAAKKKDIALVYPQFVLRDIHTIKALDQMFGLNLTDENISVTYKEETDHGQKRLVVTSVKIINIQNINPTVLNDESEELILDEKIAARLLVLEDEMIGLVFRNEKNQKFRKNMKKSLDSVKENLSNMENVHIMKDEKWRDKRGSLAKKMRQDPLFGHEKISPRYLGEELEELKSHSVLLKENEELSGFEELKLYFEEKDSNAEIPRSFEWDLLRKELDAFLKKSHKNTNEEMYSVSRVMGIFRMWGKAMNDPNNAYDSYLKMEKRFAQNEANQLAALKKQEEGFSKKKKKTENKEQKLKQKNIELQAGIQQAKEARKNGTVWATREEAEKEKAVYEEYKRLFSDMFGAEAVELAEANVNPEYIENDKNMLEAAQIKFSEEMTVVMQDFSDQPLFTHKPSIHDLEQGAVGDCYFISALSAIVGQDPEFPMRIMKDKGRTVEVEFPEKTVTVSKNILVDKEGNPLYAKVLWVGLMEKAYAASGLRDSEVDSKQNSDEVEQIVRGLAKNSNRVEAFRRYKRSVESISGGEQHIALRHLTGKEMQSSVFVHITLDDFLEFGEQSLYNKIWNSVEARAKTAEGTGNLNGLENIVEWDSVVEMLRDILQDGLEDELSNRLKETYTVRIGAKESEKRKDYRTITIDDIMDTIKDLRNWKKGDSFDGYESVLNKMKKKFSYFNENVLDVILNKLASEMEIANSTLTVRDRDNKEINRSLEYSRRLGAEEIPKYSERAKKVYQNIEKAVAEHKIVVIDTMKFSPSNTVEGDGLNGEDIFGGLAEAHAYMVMGCRTDHSNPDHPRYFVKIRNPWKTGSLKYYHMKDIDGKQKVHASIDTTGDDKGIFEVELNDLLMRFENVKIH